MSLAFLIVVAYQAYCFYHIHKHKEKAYWYIIILFFPFIGGLVYFIRRASRQDSNFSIGEHEVKPTFSVSKIKQLEQQVEIADTVTNKIVLADAYVQKGDFSKAIEIYLSCFNKFTEDDEELNEKLLAAYYLNNDFVNTIAFGKKLEGYRFFKDSKEKAYYAWSYFELKDDENAEKIFEELNVANSNHYHRLEFAKFLIEVDRHEEAEVLLDEMQSEMKEMDVYEKKGLRDIRREMKLVKEKILG